MAKAKAGSKAKTKTQPKSKARPKAKASPVAPPSREVAGVSRTVDRYAAGLYNGDVPSLKKAFRPEAIVSGWMGDESFVKPVQFLYDFINESDSPARRGDPFRCEVLGIEIAGNTATVQLAEQAYLDFDYRTCLQLMKMKGSWWIVSKLFNGTEMN
jgi:hypothetical protein